MNRSLAKVEALRTQAADALDHHQYHAAIVALSSALYLKPSDPELYEMRGEAYAALCDVHSTLLNYRRAVKLSQEEDGALHASKDTMRRQQALAKLLDLRAITMLDDGSFSQVWCVERSTPAHTMITSTSPILLIPWFRRCFF